MLSITLAFRALIIVFGKYIGHQNLRIVTDFDLWVTYFRILPYYNCPAV
jgi:hypothetical protein